jgi:SAM-dependent methyltransferase
LASTGADALLDLGCGPGLVAIPLARLFENVLAIDPDDAMRAEGARIARERGVANIQWRAGHSDDLSAASESLRLVTIGNAFHWMDRASTLEALYPLVTDDGGIALVGYVFPFPDEVPPEPWRMVVGDIVRKHLGGGRFRGYDTPLPPENRHETFVRASRFRRVKIWNERYEQTWSIDELVGNLYSTSYCNLRVLGDRATAFEQELRATMLAHEPAGILREPHEVFAVMAFKH